jgi:hypothetical protein
MVGREIIELRHVLSFLPDLAILHLSKVGMNNEDLNILAEELCTRPKLVYLNLSCNNFEHMHDAGVFRECTALTHLELWRCFLPRDAVLDLVRCSRLTHLDVGGSVKSALMKTQLAVSWLRTVPTREASHLLTVDDAIDWPEDVSDESADELEEDYEDEIEDAAGSGRTSTTYT